MELKTLRFESDSAQLIKAINSGTGGVGLYGIVSYILAIAAEFEFVVFVWIPRERNIMADRLAKEASIPPTNPLSINYVMFQKKKTIKHANPW